MKRNSMFMLILIFALLISSNVVFANGNSTITKANMLFNDTLEEEKPISLILNGKPLDFDTPPKVIEGRTLVPVRKILEALDTKVEWVDSEQKVIANNDNLKLNLWIDKKEMLVNGDKVLLDVPPMVINSRTYIPVRAVSEVLNSEVYWDGKTKSVLILNQENEKKAKELSKVLSNTDFSPGFLFETNLTIDNTSRVFDGDFMVQLENFSETEDYTFENSHISIDMGYSGFNTETNSKEGKRLEGLISTKSTDDMITFALDLLFTDNGKELPYVLSYPISKDEVSLTLEPVKSVTNFDLLSAYLAPYLVIETDDYDGTFYSIRYVESINEEFNKTKAVGEALEYVLSFTDYGSDYSLESMDFIVKSKLLTTNDIFSEFPFDVDPNTTETSEYNDIYFTLNIAPVLGY